MTIDVDITWVEAVLICATAFVAGIFRGYSGFGSALTIVPVMSAAVGPLLAVPTVVAVHFVTGLQLVPGAYRDANWGQVWPLSLSGMVGIPAGAWLLFVLDPELLRMGISILIIIFGILMLRGWRYTGRINMAVTTGVGAFGGFISGAATIGGPPVIMFLLAGPNRAATSRAAIIYYFQLSQVVALITYGLGGLLVWDVLWLSLLVAPTLIVGTWLGERLFRKTTERAFRRFALFFLIGVGVTTLFV